MIDRIRTVCLAAVTLAALGGCDRAPRAPQMNAADLSDDRGARAGRFLPPTDNAAVANDTVADNASNESHP